MAPFISVGCSVLLMLLPVFLLYKNASISNLIFLHIRPIRMHSHHSRCPAKDHFSESYLSALQQLSLCNPT